MFTGESSFTPSTRLTLANSKAPTNANLYAQATSLRQVGFGNCPPVPLRTADATAAQHTVSIHAQVTGQPATNSTAKSSVQTPLRVNTLLVTRPTLEAPSRSPGATRGSRKAKEVGDVVSGQNGQPHMTNHAEPLNQQSCDHREAGDAQNQELRQFICEEVARQVARQVAHQIEIEKQVRSRVVTSASHADAFRAYHSFSKCSSSNHRFRSQFWG